MTSDVGIDWGGGACNVNKETGIRFGVIPVNDLDPDFWNEGSSADYGSPTCGFDSGYASDAQPIGYDLDDGEYLAHLDWGDSDVCVLKSPYYTHAQFCGQCTPGAGNLRTPVEGGPRTYCFGPDCFRPNGDDEITGEYNGKKTSCPYPVYRVADDELVFQPQHLNQED